MTSERAASLCGSYGGYFPIGVAVNSRSLKTHEALIRAHFNSLTPENETKFVSVQPEPGRFTFDEGDAMAAFALKNGMKLRGHTLVWHNQTPGWVFENATRESLVAAMREHINTVARHFENSMYCWDVVNEAVEDKEAYDLRRSPWHEIIGPDFIDLAFFAAHECVPDALLYYNDYNEFIPEKRDKIVRLVKGMIERGVPVHGFGMQGHVSIYGPDGDQWRRTLDAYAGLGVRLQVTELDVSLYPPGDFRLTYDEAPEELLDKQAEYYAMLFGLLREYKQHIDGVTFWGAADDVSWLNFRRGQVRKNWPLPFDREQRPKAAFDAITRF